MSNKIKILTNGLLKENPTLRLVLGTCPTLAITTVAYNSLGMGLAATFVLICSNAAISAMRKIIPDEVHIPCYITIIASFVTVIEMLMHAYLPALYESLGVFLSLIVVNCIILGRAEMFACKNNVLDSALDGLGMGVGFTITLTLMASVREILGSGTWFGLQVLPKSITPMGILVKAPGGFFIFGCFMALAGVLEKATSKKTGKPAAKPTGCGCCPAADSCPSKGACEQ